MILVDTSIWIDHLRSNDTALVDLLDQGQVLAHPFVIGELALGNLRQRRVVLNALGDLPQSIVATDKEMLLFMDRHGLVGLGIGYVDAHLLASVQLTGHALLWTRDKKLSAASQRLGIAAEQ